MVLALAWSGGAARAQSQSNTTVAVQTHVPIPLPSLSPLVDSVSSAVVNVSAAQSEREIAENDEDRPDSRRSTFDDFLRRFFEQQGFPRGSLSPRSRQPGHQVLALGSGFIIDASGDIVTNNHVVADAEKVTITLQDNSTYSARIVGRDEQTDVALVKIDAGKPLPFADWGDSDAVKVGDWVVAVGNPFGLGGSVTSGIVSALGRNIEAGPYDDFLQIDASINRGNSGGPTFGLNGQVIGINTAIYSPSGGSVGIGFAVPANLAKNIVAQLKDQGHVTRGWLGVSVQNITPEIAKGLRLGNTNAAGALVASVSDGSPAAQAGLEPGDVITRFNSKEVKDGRDLARLIAETSPGQRAEFSVMRDGQEQHLQTTIAEAKNDARPTRTSSRDTDRGGSSKQSALGLRLSPLRDDQRRRAGLPDKAQGVVVDDVDPNSPAAGLIDPGDVILSINLQPATDPSAAAEKLREANDSKQVLLLLNRGGSQRFVELALGEGNG
jgi:serine protease Do